MELIIKKKKQIDGSNLIQKRNNIEWRKSEREWRKTETPHRVVSDGKKPKEGAIGIQHRHNKLEIAITQ